RRAQTHCGAEEKLGADGAVPKGAVERAILHAELQRIHESSQLARAEKSRHEAHFTVARVVSLAAGRHVSLQAERHRERIADRADEPRVRSEAKVADAR